MKTLIRTISYSSLVSLLAASSLAASLEDQDQSIGSEQQIQPSNYPYELSIEADYAGRSDVEKSGDFENTIQFGQANYTGTMALYFNPVCIEGLQGTVGYTRTLLDWRDNPFFDQTHFDNFIVGINAFSGRCQNWFWQARFSASFDLNHGDISHNTTYDLLLWGKYAILCNLNFHLGFLGQTGMKVDRMYPILGVDWQPNDAWKLSAVFPINVSAMYQYNCNWSVGVGGRFFDARHRVGEQQPLAGGIIAYRTIGVEAITVFTDNDWCEANLRAGAIVTGKMKISNKHNRSGTWFDICTAPYVGGEIDIKF